MPFGPGTYGDMGGGGPAASTLQRQGIPQALGMESQSMPGEAEALSEAMKMLRGGQVGAERFLAVLELLAGQLLPQMGGGQGGQPQAPQQAPQGQDIASLLGG